MLVLALGCALVLLAVVIALVWRPGAVDGSDTRAEGPTDSEPAGASSLADLQAPPLMAENVEYVETRVLDGGDLVVTHWIHTNKPMNRLTVSVPTSQELGDQTVSLTGLVVGADGEQVEAPDAVVVPAGWTGALPAAHDVYVRYQLSGILQRGGSAEGRVLALMTSADLEVGHRIVSRSQTFSGAQVLTLACLPPGPQSVPRPCGNLYDNTWKVTSDGASMDDTVIAQFDLSAP